MRDVIVVVEIVVDDDISDEQIAKDVEDALRVTVVKQEEFDEPVEVVAIGEGLYWQLGQNRRWRDPRGLEQV